MSKVRITSGFQFNNANYNYDNSNVSSRNCINKLEVQTLATS